MSQTTHKDVLWRLESGSAGLIKNGYLSIYTFPNVEKKLPDSSRHRSFSCFRGSHVPKPSPLFRLSIRTRIRSTHFNNSDSFYFQSLLNRTADGRVSFLTVDPSNSRNTRVRLFKGKSLWSVDSRIPTWNHKIHYTTSQTVERPTRRRCGHHWEPRTRSLTQ